MTKNAYVFLSNTKFGVQKKLYIHRLAKSPNIYSLAATSGDEDNYVGFELTEDQIDEIIDMLQSAKEHKFEEYETVSECSSV